MNNKITITATDDKVFTGTIDNYASLVNELNAYESNLELKKSEELKRQRMIEAEKKAKEIYQKKDFDSVQKVIDETNKIISEYEKKHGDELVKGVINGNLCAYKRRYYNQNIDSTVSIRLASDDIVRQIMKAVSEI